jgi:hypothetical protein
MRPSLVLLFSIATTLAIAPAAVAAQDTTSTTNPDPTRPPGGLATAAPAPQPASLPFEFSGVLFANYQYGGLKGSRTTNRFDIERAYLTFRATPGERLAVRVTADVYQQRDTSRDEFYRGWAVRAKYAYGQYDFVRGGGAAPSASVRFGLLQTVVIETEEQYWPRGLAPVALDQNGFFASSDAGGALTVTLPDKRGELYASITNGPGYTSRETDRFKDYAVRLTFAPFGNRGGLLQGLAISPWYSKGDRASDFARGRGTVEPVSAARRRDRAGVFIGHRDPRVVLGAQFARRWDVVETADTTRDATPTAVERAGSVTSLHTTIRPLAFVSGAPKWPLAVVLRADHIKPNVDGDPYTRNYIAGVSWEFNRRTSLTFDYQNTAPRDGGSGVDSKVYFLHLIAGF